MKDFCYVQKFEYRMLLYMIIYHPARLILSSRAYCVVHAYISYYLLPTSVLSVDYTYSDLYLVYKLVLPDWLLGQMVVYVCIYLRSHCN